MSTPEQLALATAARIAHALDPDGWARCDGRCDCNAALRCDLPRGHGNRHDDSGSKWTSAATPLPPTLAEAQAEWAAAGGDPERGPAFSGRSADGRTTWKVDVIALVVPLVMVEIRVGDCGMYRHLGLGRNDGWAAWPNGKAHPLADWRECVRLAEAADGGAR